MSDNSGDSAEENSAGEIEPIEEEDSFTEQIPTETQAQKQEKKMEIHQNESDPNVATYTFFDEDHTLGNSLRFMLAQRKDVEFVGYSIPHPSENKLNLRLQTIGKPANEIIQLGLDSLSTLCDVLSDKFEKEIEKFDKKVKGKKK